MAVVYKHIRKDTNEVFYIGIGSKKQRATSTHKRNEFWWNIVNKAGYEVEIIHEGISIDEAKQLEIKYISEYGRKDLELGTLVNLTDGGDGQFNPSIHTIEKCKQAAIKQHKEGKGPKRDKLTEDIKNKIRNTMKEYHKNHTFTEEQRKRMSDAAKKQRSDGAPTHTTPHSDEAKLKMSQARKEYWRKKKLGLL